MKKHIKNNIFLKITKTKKEKKIWIFFTPKNIVKLTYKIIRRNNLKFDRIADTSGGYGDFILGDHNNFTYVDIDEKNFLKINILHKNSLWDSNYKIILNNR